MNNLILNKKIVFSVILIYCSIVFLTAQSLVISETIGDVNRDQKIDIIDALQIALYTTGMNNQELYQPVADPNEDEVIDIIDALLVSQYSVGLIKEFPRKDPIKIVQDWAASQNINLTGYMLALFGNKATATILPGYAFVRINIRQYPIAYGPADPQLGPQCIAAVKGKSVKIAKNENELIEFYKNHQISIKDSKSIELLLKLAMKAWLTLSQELKNDGFYTFTIPDDTIVILPTDSIQVSGVSQVASGGTGAIKATALFDNAYFLIVVKEEVSLIPGIRPICQSSKLLDKDPIVRKMAEQDLMAMGVSCLDYLAIQRAKTSSPKLRAAMDQIRDKILKQEEQLRKIRSMVSH